MSFSFSGLSDMNLSLNSNKLLLNSSIMPINPYFPLQMQALLLNLVWRQTPRHLNPVTSKERRTSTLHGSLELLTADLLNSYNFLENVCSVGLCL
jgi:hypothetical protein